MPDIIKEALEADIAALTETAIRTGNSGELLKRGAALAAYEAQVEELAELRLQFAAVVGWREYDNLVAAVRELRVALNGGE